MADIRFDYTQMSTAVTKMREDIKAKYVTAGNKLLEDFSDAVSSWEGDSKEKMMTLFNTAINKYLTESIPNAIEALATLLDENAKAMQNADNQIATQIPNDLG